MSIASTVNDESLRSRKKRRTRQGILDAAALLFVQRGFQDTTIDAIAEHADISKPTFFNYFDSKLSLLRVLIDEADKHFVRYIEESTELGKDTAERLELAFLRSARHIEQNPEVAKLILTEGLSAMSDQGFAGLRFAALHDATGNLLKKGIAETDIRNDHSVSFLTQMVMGAYTYALMGWMNNPSGSLEEIMQRTAGFLCDALATRH